MQFWYQCNCKMMRSHQSSCVIHIVRVSQVKDRDVKLLQCRHHLAQQPICSTKGEAALPEHQVTWTSSFQLPESWDFETQKMRYAFLAPIAVRHRKVRIVDASAVGVGEDRLLAPT